MVLQRRRRRLSQRAHLIYCAPFVLSLTSRSHGIDRRTGGHIHADSFADLLTLEVDGPFRRGSGFLVRLATPRRRHGARVQRGHHARPDGVLLPPPDNDAQTKTAKFIAANEKTA